MRFCSWLRKVIFVRYSIFVNSVLIALPSALLAAFYKLFQQWNYIQLSADFETEGKAFTAFAGLVGFLIVFRTSQAYGRFWSGCTATHQMRAEWVDTASLIMSFIRVSKGDKEKLAEFQGTLIRLFSMLHAVALAELEEINLDATSIEDILGFRYKLIDPEGLDASVLTQIKMCESKVELLYSWIQMLITENIDSGVLNIAPPLSARIFQSLSNGMLSFFDAIKITVCPFPVPYTRTCDFLLLIHWVAAPVVITQWVGSVVLAAVFVFIQVFTLSALNNIACEIQNPFGKDANDLDGASMQEEINRHLLLLMASETNTLPRLAPKAIPLTELAGPEERQAACNKCFLEVWGDLGCDDEVPEPARKNQVYSRGSAIVRTSRGSHAGVHGGHGGHHRRNSHHRALHTISHGKPPPHEYAVTVTDENGRRTSLVGKGDDLPGVALGNGRGGGGEDGERRTSLGSPRGGAGQPVVEMLAVKRDRI